ncbi:MULTISPECIES: AMP-binding protein [unclassified Micromonospora]|uniref:AMP-binding protein n=1 Tax=unclassified Micromonospora TaxID=2617518 RepID=UPI0022C28882|nr:AMP-binding protein [Micromonospora sp. AKA38]GHJ15418.1 acetyl-CoA synthetase [Micromonospora sp. AKA38]
MSASSSAPASDLFRAARDLLQRHRDDYAAATAAFSWPRLPSFNWALDWFDHLAERPDRRDRPALQLWETSTGSPRCETTLTYAQLSARSSQLANWLLGHGVARGDAVLVMLDNRVALWETILAVMKLGAVIVPASPMTGVDGIADRMLRGGVRHVIATVASAPVFDAAGRGDVTFIASRDEPGQPVPPGWLDLEDAATAATTFTPSGPTRAQDPLMLYFTSGTTSHAKLVSHTHSSLPVGQLSTMYWIGLRRDDRHLAVASPGWAKHVCSNLFAPWSAEACVVALRAGRFDPDVTLETLRRGEVTTFCAPPTVWRQLLPRTTTRTRLRLDAATSAGEPLDAALLDGVRAEFGVTVRDGYGQTEIPGLIANSPGVAVRPGSMGRPLPGLPLVLRDSRGALAEEGEICLDLASDPIGLMAGYLGDPAATARVIRDGFYHTGDIARLDGDGHFGYVGRADDLFKSSGYRISPFELERALREHDTVTDVVVVPAADPVRFTVPKAFVELAPGIPQDTDAAGELFRFIATRLSPYQRVRRLEFVQLPRTSTGKVQRGEVQAWQRQGGERVEFREDEFTGLPRWGAATR